jgi:predicted DNA-binding transcriptional regulator YafY
MGVKNIYERFLWFEQRAKAKKYPNATVLAEKFEMSTKTAQRDIEFMRDRLNCPLLYDKHEKGYYYSDDAFSLPAVYLSPGELSSLLIARKLLKDISDGSVASELSSAVEKITRVIEKHTADAEAIDEILSFQIIEYTPTPEGIFTTVLEACLKKKSLAFTYTSPAYDEKTERTADPYHLLNYMGTWHFLGYCHKRKDLRDFVLSRMSEVKITEESFTMPKSFDVTGYMQSGFGIYKGDALKEVTLRFSPLKTKWVKSQIWHKDQKQKLLKDGSLELSFPVASFREVMMEILKHGADVEVIKPKALRDLIKEEAKEIAKIY